MNNDAYTKQIKLMERMSPEYCFGPSEYTLRVMLMPSSAERGFVLITSPAFPLEV